MEILNLTTVASVLAALLGSALSVLVAKQSRDLATQVLAESPEEMVMEALARNDLYELGNYFYEDLGRLPLAEFATDDEAQSIVSRAVGRVDRFIDDDSSDDVLGFPRDAEPQVSVAISDISEGDYWAGLSRLRRIIEVSLRALAEGREIEPGKMGAGQLIERLRGEDILSNSAAMLLRNSVHICNRAVHGEPISGEEAERALQLAIAGLDAIEA